MKTIPLTNGYRAIIDSSDYKWLSQKRWHARISHTDRNGKKTIYAANNSGRGGKSKDIYMHRLISGAERGETVDHKDRNSLNNTRKNLRVLKRRTINGLNSSYSNGASGLRGVSWHKAMNKWRARTVIAGKEIVLGYFISPHKASAVYRRYVKNWIAKRDQ